jgi:hypothetical protein
MIKCYSIVLLLSSLLGTCILSCTANNKKTPEAERFEKLLVKAKLQNEDTFKYVVWNGTSCGGCRDFSISRLLTIPNKTKMKLIVPLAYSNEAQTIGKDYLFIDSNRIFDEFYFGVDNIGIINVYKNEVLHIRNYRPDEMEDLKNDLEK